MTQLDVAKPGQWKAQRQRENELLRDQRTLEGAAEVLAREWGFGDEALCSRLRHSAIVLGEERAELIAGRNAATLACLDCRIEYGPSHAGSPDCRMHESLASGGTRAHCSCAGCF